MIVIKHDLIPTKLPECCGKCHNRVGYMCMLRGKYVEDFDTSIIDPNCPLVEVFTKDEVIAMFTEIQLEIEKHTMTSGVTNQGTWNECIACCNRLIQQKINELRGNENE